MSKTMEKAHKGRADAMHVLYIRHVKTALCVSAVTIREEAAATQ